MNTALTLRHVLRVFASAVVLACAAMLATNCSDVAGPGGDAAAIARVSGHEQPGTVGLPLDQPLVVRVTDRAGRGVAGSTVTWTTTAGNGSVSDVTSIADNAGHASTSWTLGTTAGEQTVTAAAAGAGATSFSATAAPGLPTALEKLAGDEQEQAAGLVLPVPLEVRVIDTWGNAVPGAPIVWSASAGGGAIINAGANSDASGRASARLRLGAQPGPNAVTASIGTAASATFAATAIFDRMDRDDDVAGAQVHVVYVVPADGTDRNLDRNGTLARSVASFQNWLRSRSGGFEIRFDTFAGDIDVSFFRLARTDTEIRAHGAFVVTQIEAELGTAGRISEDKLYLVYYDGGSTWSCGGAAWPPSVPGRVAAMYLQGTPPGASCGDVAFVNAATDFPGYWEFAALHDLVHTIGIVSTSAPNHTHAYPAHVPDRNDLMYSGPQSWIIDTTTVIDVNGDDYFGPDLPAHVPNLAASPYLRRATVATLLNSRLTPPTPAALTLLAEQVRTLPIH